MSAYRDLFRGPDGHIWGRAPNGRLQRVEPCCPVVRAFLQAIGVEAVNPITPRQILVHFEQERARLFPELAAAGMGRLVAELHAEHATFEHEIVTTGDVRSWELFREHSEREDRAVIELLRARR